MLSWYNRNITQTEICLHNTLYLNRIFTAEKKKGRKLLSLAMHGLNFLLFCADVGKCSAGFVYQNISSRTCRARVQGPQAMLQH